jgi:membrane protein
VQAAKETPEPPAGRLRRARVLYRNVSKRKMAWHLLKDTVNSCLEYRILGLAAEAAFWTLLSLPPCFSVIPMPNSAPAFDPAGRNARS